MKPLKNTVLTFFTAALIIFTASCTADTQNEVPDYTPTTEDISPVESPIESDNTDDNSEESEEQGFDFESAYAAFKPDTVMMTAGEYDITWDELFFYICNSLSYVDSGLGIDLSENAYDDMTYAQLVLDYAKEDALSYKAILYGSKLQSIELTESDYAEIDEYYQSAITEFGSEEALLERLREYSNIYSRELFDYLISTDMLLSRCFEEMYGSDASQLPDDAVTSFVQSNGYLKAKHILRLNSEEDTAEGEKPKALLEAEEILKKLDNYSGSDLESYFDELMNENSEDSGGLASYPDGYLFMPGTMVPEFYDGCAELEPGQYSGIIESTHGYHIIYRLPINYDEVPYEYSSQGSGSTLRQIAASNVFGIMLSDWADCLEITYTDTYNSLSLPEIFKKIS